MTGKKRSTKVAMPNGTTVWIVYTREQWLEAAGKVKKGDGIVWNESGRSDLNAKGIDYFLRKAKGGETR